MDGKGEFEIKTNNRCIFKRVCAKKKEKKNSFVRLSTLKVSRRFWGYAIGAKNIGHSTSWGWEEREG